MVSTRVGGFYAKNGYSLVDEAGGQFMLKTLPPPPLLRPGTLRALAAALFLATCAL